MTSSKDNIIDNAKRVLTIEADALIALADQLPHDFQAAV